MRVCPKCAVETEAEICPQDDTPTVDAEKLKVKADPSLGMVIAGKYRVEERLGKGGFGAVYRARHVETAGAVAVKLVRGELIDDETIIRRFYLEAQNTHKLHHPNTVRVSDFGRTDEGTLYLVMEFVQGHVLSDELRLRGPMAAARVVRISTQILKSLGEAHASSIVHRDIKPQNIMLVDQFGEPDFVKVLDFGISRSLDTTGTTTKGLLGTPRYMAPEQWLSLPVDARTDLYALGMIMYELFTDRLPFDLNDARGGEAAMGLMAAHVKTEPVPIRQLTGRRCPEPLARLIMRMIAKKPADRPQSCQEVLRALTRVQTESGFNAAVQPRTVPSNAQLDPSVITDDYAPEPTTIESAETLARPQWSANGEATLALPEGEARELAASPAPGGLPRWAWVVAAAAVVAAVAVLVWPPGPAPSKKVTQKVVVPAAAATAPQKVKPQPVKPVLARTQVALRTGAATTMRGRAGLEPPPKRSAMLALDTRPGGASVTVKETGETLAGITPIRAEASTALAARLDRGEAVTLVFKKRGHHMKPYRVAKADLKEGKLVVRVRLKEKRTRPALPAFRP